jgi:hypothetical protein
MCTPVGVHVARVPDRCARQVRPMSRPAWAARLLVRTAQLGPGASLAWRAMCARARRDPRGGRQRSPGVAVCVSHASCPRHGVLAIPSCSPGAAAALLRDAFTKPRALVSPKCILSACTCIRVRAARRRVSYDVCLPVDSPVYPLPPHMHALSPLVSPLPSCRALESSCAVRTCCARRRAR